MIRTTVTPNNQMVSFEVPKNYIGKKIEIIAFAQEEGIEEPAPKGLMSQFWGTMSNETAMDLHNQTEQSRKEWDKNI